MRAIQSFNYSLNVNQNSEKKKKKSVVKLKWLDFMKQQKYTDHGTHETKIAEENKEVGCLRKVDINTSLHEHLVWS